MGGKSKRMLEIQPGEDGEVALVNRAKQSRYKAKPSAKVNQSPYFNTPFQQGPARIFSPIGIQRSRFFVTSPDSCLGSALTFDWGSAYTEEAVEAFRACPFFQSHGVRHLCNRLCYLHAYEPCRKWHTLRRAVVDSGGSSRLLDQWAVRIGKGRDPERSGTKAVPWRISYVSPHGEEYSSVSRVLKILGLADSPSAEVSGESMLKSQGRHVEIARPEGPSFLLKEGAEAGDKNFPYSPFGLIEEMLTDDPWRLLLSCIMLNQTTRSQVDPVLVKFLARFPDAPSVLKGSLDEVAAIVAPLGLQEKRPRAIIRFSDEYLNKPWQTPTELHWVGKYGADAYKIFINREWKDIQASDHALNWWVEWKQGVECQALSRPAPVKDTGRK
ncbi:unnamed protein product [Discosporangium mesarthrocarpum]